MSNATRSNISTISSSSSYSKCDPWYSQTGASLEFPVYQIIVPLQFVFGLSLTLVCLLAFYRQAKKEEAYWYQILITLVKCVEHVATGLYGLAYIFYFGHATYPSVRANYVLMWYSAHLAIPLCHMSSTTIVLLALCMSVDRLWAVSRPFSYRNLNHRRHQFGTFVCCVILGVLASLFDCFRYNAVVGRGGYTLQTNTVLIGSTWGEAAVWFRNVLRLVNVLVMVIINVLVIRAVVRRVQKVRMMTFSAADASTSTAAEARKEKRAVANEMTLALLTATQCVFISLIVVFTSIYYAATYTVRTFENCESMFWAPVLDASVMISNTLEYYAIIVLSKKFRRMLTEHVPCFKVFC